MFGPALRPQAKRSGFAREERGDRRGNGHRDAWPTSSPLLVRRPFGGTAIDGFNAMKPIAATDITLNHPDHRIAPNLGPAKQAAAVLGIPPGTFRAWVSQGRIPACAVVEYGPRARVYDLDEIVRWRESRRQGPVPPRAA